LKDLFEAAGRLDLLVLSVGGLQPATTTTHQVGFLSEADLASLEEGGAVGDILFHFIDSAGRPIEHPLNDRVMSVDLDRLRRAKRRILTSGGPDKTEALPAALAAVEPHIFITDEFAARR